MCNNSIDIAKESEALSRDLASIAQLCDHIHVTRLQNCLVNVVASSLRYVATFMAKIDQSHQRQEYEYLDATQKEVHSRIGSLLVNLKRHKDLEDAVRTNIQSMLEGQEKALFSFTNTTTIGRHLLARHRCVLFLYDRYGSDDLTTHVAEETRG